MARYIDADKFLKDQISRCGCVPLVGSCTMDNESLKYILDTAPTADVVEVVRCKDCKYFNYGVCACSENITHSYDYDDYVYDHYIYVSPEHFCSYGERRTDNAG